MTSVDARATGSDAFLDGQGIAVEFRAIEDELDRLWGPAAEQAGVGDQADVGLQIIFVLADESLQIFAADFLFAFN